MRRSDLPPLVRRWAEGENGTVTMTLTGAHGVAESRTDPLVRAAHEDADYVLCDGTPPFLGAVLNGHRTAVDRIPGRDAMRDIAAAAPRRSPLSQPLSVARRPAAGNTRPG